MLYYNTNAKYYNNGKLNTLTKNIQIEYDDLAF